MTDIIVYENFCNYPEEDHVISVVVSYPSLSRLRGRYSYTVGSEYGIISVVN